MLAYSMVVILAESVWGDVPSTNLPIFLSAYGAYLLMPLLLLVRVYPQTLFTAPPPAASGKKRQ
jgi:hypothetical protein